MIKGFFIDKDKDVLTLDTNDKTFSLPTWVVQSNEEPEPEPEWDYALEKHLDQQYDLKYGDWE